MAIAPANATGLLYSADGLAVGQLGRVCVVLWREGVTRERFEVQRSALAKVAADHPDGTAFVCIVEPTASPPDESLRVASLAMLDEHREQLKCVALVVEGSGFGAAVVRSALSGMALLWRSRPAPLSFFSEPLAAMRWASDHVGPIPPGPFQQLLAEMRRSLSPADAHAP